MICTTAGDSGGQKEGINATVKRLSPAISKSERRVSVSVMIVIANHYVKQREAGGSVLYRHLGGFSIEESPPGGEVKSVHTILVRYTDSTSPPSGNSPIE